MYRRKKKAEKHLEKVSYLLKLEKKVELFDKDLLKVFGCVLNRGLFVFLWVWKRDWEQKVCCCPKFWNPELHVIGKRILKLKRSHSVFQKNSTLKWWRFCKQRHQTQQKAFEWIQIKQINAFLHWALNAEMFLSEI